MGSSVRLVQSLVIAREPRVVWDFTQDWSRRSAWDPALVEVELAESEPPVIRICGADGCFYTLRYSLYEAPVQSRYHLIDCDPWWLGGEGGSSYELVREGTRWTRQHSFRCDSAWRSILQGRHIAERFRKSMLLGMQQAKSLLETGPAIGVSVPSQIGGHSSKSELT